MTIIVTIVCLISLMLAIFWATYALSPVSRLRRRVRKSVQNFNAAVEDLKSRSYSLRDGLRSAAAKYIDEARIARLRVISVDELRNYRKGLLLQPLKQAGLYTLADVRGWDAGRLGNLRGVGPSSAASIASTAAAIISDSWNKPVPHPCVPFSTQERPLIEAIYRIRQFDSELGEKSQLYQKQADVYGERLRNAFEKTKFAHWLTASLNQEAIAAGTKEAESLYRELGGIPSSSDTVTSSIELCAKIAHNAVSTEELVNDFNNKREYYDWTLTANLGKASTAQPLKAAFGAAEPVSVPIFAQPAAPTRAIRQPSLQSITFKVDVAFSEKKFQGSNLWVPAGRDVAVCGYTVPGGSFYLGHLDLNRSGPEPSVIDPTLPIAGPTGCHERLMGYWPSYSSISPEARAAYLNWLSTGKSDPQADIGYVFLYFYGLEKRLFTLPSFDRKITPEIDTIRTEIERLAGIYGDRGTFGSYSGSLLDYIEAKNVTAADLETFPSLPKLNESPLRHLSVKVAAGVYAKAGRPLPAEWAYCLYTSTTSGGVDSAEGPFAELGRQVFSHEYKECFGEGITFSQTGSKISVNHHFGNASLMRSTETGIEIPLPDVTLDQQAMEGILKIGHEAGGATRKFSTFAAENPEECHSLSGLGILPAALWPSGIREMYADFRSNSPKVMRFRELPGYPPPGATLKRLRLNNFIEKLASMGLGMEPDSRLGAELPGPDDPVAVFVSEELEKRNSISKQFNGAALLLHLASIVACSSEGFSDTEASAILHYLDSEIDLPEFEKRRLAARLAIYRQYPPSTTRLKKQINEMAGDAREGIGNFLVQVAAADGTVDPSEIRTLERLFEMLGLERLILYSKIHSAQMHLTVSAIGATKADSVPGEIQFDPARIATLRAESTRISTILDKVFDSTDEPVEAADPKNQNTLLGLDLEHSDLLKALLSKPQWSRPEVELLCSGHGLMIDGAFERINDAAFDQFDSPIIEGEDPVDINCDLIVKETA
jgi:tellurite resistance protein